MIYSIISIQYGMLIFIRLLPWLFQMLFYCSYGVIRTLSLLINNLFIFQANMNGKTFAALITCIGIISILAQYQHISTASDFEEWKVKHSISFESQLEDAYRQKVFLDNLNKIKTHNADLKRTYNMGLNQFSSLTQDQFTQTYLTLRIPNRLTAVQSPEMFNGAGNIDWRSEGAVTPIQNQGQCGSSWAFSATGALQGLSKIAYNKLQSFSNQQLIDCTYETYGNYGCNGGFMTNSFKYVQEKGIATEQEYPYKGANQKCQFDGGAFKISGYTEVKTCDDVASALLQGPVATAADATTWQTYSSGVLTNCKTNPNHGISIVGIVDGVWILKNTWGVSWGEKGFIRLGPGNTCAICNMVSYPKK